MSDQVKKDDNFCSKCGQGLPQDNLVNHIGIVLDSSGSMETIRDQAIDMFNEQMSTIRKEASDMKNLVTLVSFDSHVNDPTYDGVDLDNVQPLDRNNYMPGGMTALYDAIGSTIERMSGTDSDNNAYLLIVITDGQENHSSDFTSEKLKELIKEKEASGKWTVTFLGANQDVALAQKSLGLSSHNVMSFTATKIGTNAASVNVSNGMKSYFGARRVGSTQVTNFYAGDKSQESKEDSADSE